MLNGNLKKEAVQQLRRAHSDYEALVKTVKQDSEALFTLRQESSQRTIGRVEAYINQLANSPKEFDRSFAAYKAEFQVFKNMIREIEQQSLGVDVKTGAGATSGVAAGIGVAAFAPTVAMATATTFGVASTGTAISTLSGAAATNAALAWLGGGALSVGGGGMAGGSALLALAGPVGWTIGGTALVGSGLFARSKNRKIAEEANAQRKAIEVHIATMKAAIHEIQHLMEATRNHVQGVNALLDQLLQTAPRNYRNFTEKQKDCLGALINHIHSLSELLNKKVQA